MQSSLACWCTTWTFPSRLHTLLPNYLQNPSLNTLFTWSKPDQEWLPFCYSFHHRHMVFFIISMIEEGGCCLGNQNGGSSAWFLLELSATWIVSKYVFISALACDGKNANTSKFSFLFLLLLSSSSSLCFLLFFPLKILLLILFLLSKLSLNTNINSLTLLYLTNIDSFASFNTINYIVGQPNLDYPPSSFNNVTSINSYFYFNGFSLVLINTFLNKIAVSMLIYIVWIYIKWLKCKRNLFLGRKAMTHLESMLKSRDTTLLTKVHIVKAMVLPVIMYRCESLFINKAEHQRTDALELCCLRRLLRVLGLQGDQTSQS